MRLLSKALLTSILAAGSSVFVPAVKSKSGGVAQNEPFFRFTALALFTLLLSISTPSPVDASVQPNITILVLGDSISAAYGLEEREGWVALLADELKDTHPNVNIVNASISGETTGGGLQRLPTALEKFDPQLLIIELGGNDALRGQSLKQMRSNLTSMISLADQHGAKSLILGMRIPTNYGAVYTERFFASFATVAEETGASLVPFFLEPIATDRTFFQPDGVHPTKEAQDLMLQHVLNPIRSLLDSFALPTE